MGRLPVDCGPGVFGHVWKGSYNETTVMIKKLSSMYGGARPGETKEVRRFVEVMHDNRNSQQIFCKKVIQWKRLSNPNILPFIGAYVNGLDLVLVSEWMNNGDIKQYLKINPGVDKPRLVNASRHL